MPATAASAAAPVSFVPSSVSAPAAKGSDDSGDSGDSDVDGMDVDDAADADRHPTANTAMDNDDESDRDDDRPSFGSGGQAGLGFASSASSMGSSFNMSAAGWLPSSKPSVSGPRSSSSSFDATIQPVQFQPASSSGSSKPAASQPVLRSQQNHQAPQQQQQQRQEQPKRQQEQRTGGGKRRDKSDKTDKDFGKFEQYTKGFGSKMLAKMGYVEGKGLGAGGRGITAPIDVKLRPSGMGLGHGGFDERTETVRREQAEKVKSDDEEDAGDGKGGKAAPKKKTDGWKRTSAKKAKPQYKTAEELIAEQMASASTEEALAAAALVGGNAAVHAPTKIIDMTGKEARVISSLAQAASAASAIGPDMTGRLPELRHNVRLIAQHAQSDLLALSRRVRVETARKTQQESDARALAAAFNTESTRLQRLRAVQGLVAECRSLTAHHANDFATVAPDMAGDLVERIFGRIFDELQTKYVPEYTAFGLDGLVVAMVLPIFKRMMATWNPLDAPTFGASTLRKWKALLVVNRSSSGIGNENGDSLFGTVDGVGSMTPFEAMVYTLWLPRVRKAINNDWNVHDPGPILDLIEAWYDATNPQRSLIPVWMFHNIAVQLIMPKMERAVEDWRPMPSTAIAADGRPGAVARGPPLPHTWLHPWLPVLGDLLQPFYPVLRRKFETAWRDWHPSDHSPIDTLRPWIPVLPSSDFDRLLTTTILPGLVRYLQASFAVVPAAQDISPLVDHLFPWHGLIPTHLFSELLATEVFTKWSQVLWMWITAPGANLDEVTQWYIGWKRLFEDAGLGSVDAVVKAWRSALDMMNQGLAVRGGGHAYAPPKPSATASAAGAGGSATVRIAAAAPDLSFKDYVEAVAAERNLKFVPVHRVHEGSGKPLYRLGKRLLVYMDNGVLFASVGVSVPSGAGGGKADMPTQSKREWTYISVDDAMQQAASMI
ncbi:GC-rich sequence DNA-binding factor-like protein-domain-containing protein [Entophlyctis helioformis]|nr:GC-rich sequence DNA-binding factor-like protein-domain-containing protein [Entophlyctis helioformis]